ncbi:hypothetical protein Q8791_09595 [Nocardiopsis sp. CT-R113]|uniref:Uncharacterized protein n=1 Tax=Nocardiopsis codii TaxID=3065942 RepID=A0ABU7K5E7_9ACTN|nr:hypothetical protein [Nocardiopsis sp. CT-R113]MEE2037471.1 hypothetical protein [Nocardiopsis sp. CT-R113]
MSDLASDGTPLMRPYTEHAEHRADILMQERERAAADAATGLARLAQIAAEQQVAAAQARLDAARARVDAADTVRLGVAIRHWRRKATGTSPER